VAVVTSRRLVVTADDFGLSPAVNRGVEAGFRHGIVTSASLMVRRAHAGDAVIAARRLPGLCLGLHVELVSYEVRDDCWTVTDQLVDPSDHDAVEREVADQLSRFVAFVGRPPTHIDSHHHLHREDPLDRIVTRVAEALRIPVRGQGEWRYCGDFYGQHGRGHPWPQGITAEALATLLEGLEPGVTELACHPADSPDAAHGTYDAERVAELAALVSPEAREAVERAGVELIGPESIGT
jgi:predicted glycoside hydrolase/deacetylase ChbG (UPF0249 family)